MRMMKQKRMLFSGKLHGKGGRGKLMKEGLEEERGIPQHLRRLIWGGKDSCISICRC